MDSPPCTDRKAERCRRRSTFFRRLHRAHSAPAADQEPLNRYSARPEADEVRPKADDDLAFLLLKVLANLVRNKKVSSTELTKQALAGSRSTTRLEVDPDGRTGAEAGGGGGQEIAAGKYRGRYGIPWAAKDLISYGYRPPGTSRPDPDEKATVAERLDAAGAAHAKVSL